MSMFFSCTYLFIFAPLTRFFFKLFLTLSKPDAYITNNATQPPTAGSEILVCYLVVAYVMLLVSSRDEQQFIEIW